MNGVDNMADLNYITSELAKVARETLPEAVKMRSGRVLYSPVETLVSGSPIYFLGANPGEVPGSTMSHALLTIESDIKRLEDHTITKHAMLEEEWKGNPKGQAQIQQRAVMVFSILAGGDRQRGIELLHRTPTSNMIFPRSPDMVQLEQTMGKKSVDLALMCWPFHNRLIQLVEPKLVLTYAVTVARQLAERIGLGKPIERPSGHGDMNCCAWRFPNGAMLLAIPSLSRYKPSGVKETALKAFFRDYAPLIVD
jgi:hypothetical protein